MMIWAILVLTSVYSLIATVIAGSYAQATDAARQSLKRNGLTMSASGLGCVIGLGPWLIAACWVVYAWQVSDWRFAAITLVPKVAGLLVHIARPRAAAPAGTGQNQ